MTEQTTEHDTPQPPPESGPPPEPQRCTDPWAHRRGEPRVFAFFWTMYLLMAAMGALASAGVLASVESYRPAASRLLFLVAAGITVLWPMVRLSQTRPRRTFAPGVEPRPDTPCPVALLVLQDVMVLLVPAQAIIWPQWWLAGWSWRVLSALSALLCAWGLLTGAVLARALTAPGRLDAAARTWWTILCLGIVAAGPIVAALGAGRSPWIWMLSPLTGVFEITRDRSSLGVAAFVLPEHWVMILAPAIVGVFGWAAVLWRAGGRRPIDDLH